MKKTRNYLIVLILTIFMIFGLVTPTFSWLSASSNPVVNTFSGGAISLILDEAKVDGNGKKTDSARVTENSYRFEAGAILDKDPTVTVLKGSDTCYVFLYVDNPLPEELFIIDYSSNWLKIGENGTAGLYVYQQTVDALQADVVLEPIFTQIQVSNVLTSDDILALGTKTMTIQAYAVQSVGIGQEEAFHLAKDYFISQFGISEFSSLDILGTVDTGEEAFVEEQIPENDEGTDDRDESDNKDQSESSSSMEESIPAADNTSGAENSENQSDSSGETEPSFNVQPGNTDEPQQEESVDISSGEIDETAESIPQGNSDDNNISEESPSDEKTEMNDMETSEGNE